MSKKGHWNHAARKKSDNGICFEPLEPRLLLSGSLDAGIGSPVPESLQNTSTDTASESAAFFDSAGRSILHDQHLNQSLHQEERPVDTLSEASERLPSDATDPVTHTTSINNTGESAAANAAVLKPGENNADGRIQISGAISNLQELVFVDSGIQDYDQIVDDLLARNDTGADLEVVVLDLSRNGIEQVSKALTERQDIDAVHFVTHGTDRAIKLGDTWLHAENLSGYADDIAGWKESLADGADLLFYGCELAGKAEGRDLLASLVNLTGADVAASTDTTGNAKLGGDWDLEYKAGTIESSNPISTGLQSNWSGVLDTFTVTETSDGGAGSLRQAVIDANALPGADTIILPAGTYTLTIGGTAEDDAALGDLDIKEDLTIRGAGAANTIIDGASLDRVFEIMAVTTVTLEDLTISGGSAPDNGGGVLVWNNTTVSLNRVAFVNNHASQYGGGIYLTDNADVTLTDVTLDNNSADKDGGGMYVRDNTNPTLTNVSFTDNTATDNGGGLFLRDNSNTTLNGGSFENNTAGKLGGGLYLNDAADATLNDVSLIGNSATEEGGGIRVGKSAGIELNRTVISGSSSGKSGGGMNIESSAIAKLTDVAISDNTASDKGGGINNSGITTLTHVTITANSAARGGGINNDGSGADLDLINVTISGNSASNEGGGLRTREPVEITNATIADNTAVNTGAGLDIGGGSGHVTLQNSILDNNRLTNGTAANVEGPNDITSLGFNISSDDTAAVGLIHTDDFPVNTDPRLGPLLDYGGPTMTHALLDTSPAIDPMGLSGAPIDDQRGFSRDATPDIGAFEYAAGSGALNQTPIINDQNHTVDEHAANGTAIGTITASDNDPVVNHTMLYWVDVATDELRRINIDGTGNESLALQMDGTSGTGLRSVAVDDVNGRVYWINNNTNEVWTASLDGTGSQSIVSGPDALIGIAADGAAGKIYWFNITAGELWEADLDGSNAAPLITSGLGNPNAVAVDAAGGKIYWTQRGANAIMRADLDGSNIETVVAGPNDPFGIALDIAAGKVYWAEPVLGQIHRADMIAGATAETVVTGLLMPRDVAVDIVRGKIYTADAGTNRIVRSNLDGSYDGNVTFTGDWPLAIAIGPPVQNLTYSITGGNTNGAFDIDPVTGAITVANSTELDFETTPVFSLTVTVTDAGGLSDNAIVTVSLMDINDSVNANDDTYSVDEDATLVVSDSGVLSNDTGEPTAPTPGHTLNFVAGQDTDGDQVWEDDNGTGGFNWSLHSSVTRTTTPTTAIPGIDAAYVFDGSGGGTIGSTFEDLTGDPSNNSASFEIWFNPTDAIGQEILFDAGGTNNGASLSLNGATLEFKVTDGSSVSLLTADLSAEIAADEFIQIVGVIDFDVANTDVHLFVDGNLVDSDIGVLSMNDWSGWDPVGLGDVNFLSNTSNTGNFEGQIAVFRFYEMALSDTEVKNNYDALTGRAGLTATNLNTTGTVGTVALNPDGSFTYTPAAEWSGVDSFSYTAEDGSTSDTATVTITVDPVNDPPVNSVPGSQTTDEDTALEFSSTNSNLISVSDVDDHGSSIQVRLTATNGVITLGGFTGLTFTAGDGTADGTIQFSGTVTDINAALDGLTFNPSADYSGPAAIQIVTDDLGNTGTGGALSDTDTIDIDVIAVNDPPAVSLNITTTTLPEDTDTSSRIKVADITISDDTLGTNNLSLSGLDAAMFEIDGTELFLSAGAVLNFESNPDLDVTVVVDDTSIGSTPEDSASMTIDVTNVNEPPSVALNNTVTLISENTSTASRIKVADINITDDALGTNDLSLAGADAAMFEIIGSQLFLKAGALLDFESNPNLDVTVSVDDASLGSGPEDTAALSIGIMNVNEAPVAFDDSYTIDEDTTLNSNTAWYDPAWSVRQTLSFNNLAQNENLSNFPVLLALDATRIDYSQTQNNGEDLRFLDGDGNLLAHDIEVWNKTGTSYVWVKVPQIEGNSNTDFIWMYYGNSGAADGQNKAAVWSNDYQAVYHLNENPGGTGTVTDSAGNFNGINNFSGDTAGYIGNAQDFDGNNDYITMGWNQPFLNNAAGATISAWVKADDLTSAGILGVSINAGPTDLSRAQLTIDNGDLEFHARSLDSDPYLAINTSGQPLSTGNWHYLVGVVDYASDEMSLYVDGVQSANLTSVGFAATASSSLNSWIGVIGKNENSSTREFDGILDEVRLADSARSVDWITAQYASMTDNFVTYGQQQSVSGVLDNDIDSDGDALSAVLVGPGPANAQSFTLNADGSFTYTPNNNFNGIDTFSYRTTDGALVSNIVTVTITVNPINDEPDGSDHTVIAFEDTDYTFSASDFGFSDPGDVPTDSLLAVKITSLPTAGSLTNDGMAVADGQFISIADINNGHLKFTPGIDENGAGYASFTFQVQDDGGTTGSGVDLDASPNTMNINVTAVNDAPGLTTTPADPNFIENSAPVSLFTGTAVDPGESGDRIQAIELTVTGLQNGTDEHLIVAGTIIELTDGNSVLTGGVGFDVDVLVSGSTATVTITRSGNISIGTTETLINNLAYENLSEDPLGVDRVVTLTSIMDDGGTADGGQATTTLNFGSTVTITPVNDAPKISLANTTASLAENTDTSSRIKVSDIVVTDDTMGARDLALTGFDAAMFEIIGTELYLIAGATLDFESNPNLDVAVTVNDPALIPDPNDTAAMTIGISDVNEPPTVSLNNMTATLAEDTDTTSRIKVADITVADDALGARDLALTGADAAMFEIVGNELYLIAGATLNFESNPNLDVAVTVNDPALAPDPNDSAAMTIGISDVNEPPTVSLNNMTATLAEDTDTTSRIKVADISVSDDVLGARDLALTGFDAAMFEIIGSELYLIAGATLDFESNPNLDVAVTVNDPALAPDPNDTASMTIGITDANEPPTVALSNMTATLAEDTDTSSRIKVADISVADDALGVRDLALTGADAALFEIIGSELYLIAGATLDFESNPNLDVAMTVNDPALAPDPNDTAAMTIGISDVNEPPTVSLSNMTATLAEDTDTTSRSKVADITVTDDALGARNLALTGADAAQFEIIGSELYLIAGVTLDFESNPNLDVAVTVNDPALAPDPNDSASMTIGITDVNEPPTVALTNVTATLAEDTDTTSRIKVADISVADDALGARDLALTGADAGMFEIIGSELYLIAGVTLDFESNPNLDVTVTVNDPALAPDPNDTAAMTIGITDANEPPTVALNNMTATLAEDTDTTSRIKVADITVTDDALGASDLALTGADAAMFEIVGSALYLIAGASLNFESNPNLDVAVTVNDPALAPDPNDSASMTIGIADVNEPPTLALTNVTATMAEDTVTTSRIKVADIVVTDDALGSNSLSLNGGDAATFEIVGTELFLRAGATLDVNVTVDDNTVGANPDDSAALAISITDVNEPPSISLNNTITTLADDTDTTGRIKVADIVISDDALDSNGLTLSGTDAGMFEISGMELFLRAGATLDFATNPSLDVTVEVVDPTVGSDPDDTASLNIAVTRVNDAPTATNLNAGENYIEDTPLNLADIVVTDVDSTNVTVTLTLSDSAAGQLSTGSSGAVTATFAGGVWTASGDIADVNTLLAGVTFTPSANYDDNFTIVVSVDDGEAAPVTGAKNISGRPVGDTPQVGDTETRVNTQSGLIVINRHASDGAEVTHFRISGITNGSLYHADGVTPIHDGDFITYVQGQAGVRFTPTGDSSASGSFTIESSEDGTSVARQSGGATATVTVIMPAELPSDNNDSGGDGSQEQDPDTTPEDQDAIEELEETIEETILEQDDAAPVVPPVNQGPGAQGAQANSSITGALESYLVQVSRDIKTAGADGIGIIDLLESLTGNDESEQGPALSKLIKKLNIRSAHAFNAMSAVAYEYLGNSLDEMKDEMKGEIEFNRSVVGSAIVMSTGLSVGYVVWLLRSGMLLSSLLSSMPAWRILDPLPILAGKKDDAESEDEESLETILKQKPSDADKADMPENGPAEAESPTTDVKSDR